MATPWPVEAAMQQGWPGTKSVKVKGSYSYDDAFGKRMSGEFCKIWTPMLNIITPQVNATVGTDPPCDQIETRIADILARKRSAEKQQRQPPKPN